VTQRPPLPHTFYPQETPQQEDGGRLYHPYNVPKTKSQLKELHLPNIQTLSQDFTFKNKKFLTPSPHHGGARPDILFPINTNIESSPPRLNMNRPKNIPNILRSPQFRSVHFLNLPTMPQTTKGNSAPNQIQNRLRTPEEEFLASKMPTFEADNIKSDEGIPYEMDQRDKRRNLQRMKNQSGFERTMKSNKFPGVKAVKSETNDDKVNPPEINETFGAIETNNDDDNILILDNGFTLLKDDAFKECTFKPHNQEKGEFNALMMTSSFRKGRSDVEKNETESIAKTLMGSGEHKLARVKSGGALDQKIKFPKEVFGINMKKKIEIRK